MPSFALRAILAALLLSLGDDVLAQPAPAEDQRLLPYVAPGQLVDIGGRRINLHCTGAGAPAVILMAGSSSWSPVWYKVQPVIAQETRVCAFDRAGLGFSDPAPRFQILSDVVDDLHAALKAGAIPEPYVLVGHSLGGIEVRIYAQSWPQEVAGMVLVDTSPAGEGFLEANQPGFDEVYGGPWTNTAGLLHCAFLAANGPLDPAALAKRHARRVQESLSSVLHRLLSGRSGLAHVVAIHAPLRQRRPPPPGRNAARRAVAGRHMGSQHAR